MNFLEITFLLLNLFTLIFGGFVNYLSSLLPTSVIQLFRYGRANSEDHKKPGFVRAIEVPKRWFWHFYTYAVLLQLAVVLTVFSTYSRNSPSPNSWLVGVLKFTGIRDESVDATCTIIATCLFLIHLCRRLYETLCVSIFSNTKMNVVHYLLGYIHYTGTIFCLVGHSPFFATSNRFIGNKEMSKKDEDPFRLTKIGSLSIFSIALLLLGNYLQNRAHVGLANLRKGKDKKESSGHKIPRGGMFELISCPNYFAEILIYVALSGLFGWQNRSLNFCTVWVICNQVTAGIMNHHWYKSAFKDYPPHRRAVIPFIL